MRVYGAGLPAKDLCVRFLCRAAEHVSSETAYLQVLKLQLENGDGGSGTWCG